MYPSKLEKEKKSHIYVENSLIKRQQIIIANAGNAYKISDPIE